MAFHDLKADLGEKERELRNLYDVGFMSFDDQFIFPHYGKDGGILSTAATLILVFRPDFIRGDPLKATFALLIPNPFYSEDIANICAVVERAAEVLSSLEWVKQGEQDPNRQPRFTSMAGGLLGDPLPLSEVEKRYGALKRQVVAVI